MTGGGAFRTRPPGAAVRDRRHGAGRRPGAAGVPVPHGSRPARQPPEAAKASSAESGARTYSSAHAAAPA